MKRLSHASALQVAAILSFLLGLVSLIALIPFLLRGAEDLNRSGD